MGCWCCVRYRYLSPPPARIGVFGSSNRTTGPTTTGQAVLVQTQPRTTDPLHLRFRSTSYPAYEPSACTARYARVVTVGVTTLDAVRARREEILSAARRRRASRVRVFGSVARGEAKSDSDVDFLVDFEPDASLLDQVGLIHDLHDLLGVDVDVVSSDGLRPRHEPIRQEAVDL